MRRILLAAAVLSQFTLSLSAQRIAGEIAGTIVDPTGAAVSGAKITAVDRATQRSWAAEANSEGIYRLVSLPPGAVYDVRFENAGFRTAVRENVPLDVGQVRRLDVQMEVGAVTENVTVSAEANPLGLERGEVSAVVKQRAIVDLPLNGRNVYQLAELQPGVVRVAGSGLQESETTDAQIGAGGTRYRDNQVLLDGVTNNNDRQGGRDTLSLSPDAVDQFRIVTNSLSAEYGRSGGALISVITRGGTNDP